MVKEYRVEMGPFFDLPHFVEERRITHTSGRKLFSADGIFIFCLQVQLWLQQSSNPGNDKWNSCH